MKTYYYIYKITILKGCWKGKYYIGKHETTNLNDDYVGSGTKITAWFKKKERIEGRDYKKEIICYCKDADEMWKMENYYIGDKYETDDMCLNCMAGGHGGKGSEEVNQKIRDIYFSKSDEEKEEINNKRTEFWKKYPNKRKKVNNKISKQLKGRKWVNKGDIHIIVKPEEIPYYISLGYELGSGFHYIKPNKKIRVRKTKEEKEENFRLRNLTNKDRVWLNNGISEKWALPKDLTYLKSIGYIDGRLEKTDEKKTNYVNNWKNSFYSHKETQIKRRQKISKENKGRIWINNGKENTMCKPEELPTYLANGWVKGRLKEETIGKVRVIDSNNKNRNKLIYIEELPTYLANGWHQKVA